MGDSLMFSELFNHSPLPYIILDEDLKIIEVNGAFVDLIEESKDVIIGNLFSKYIVNRRKGESLITEIDNILKTGNKDTVDIVIEVKGETIHLRVYINKIVVSSICYYLLMLRPVEDYELHIKKLEFLSYHDSLTKLKNRRFYEEESRRMDIEENLPISIISVDVNGLSIINNSFGHSTGDQLLVIVADTLRESCRDEDFIARLGGDEFALFLPKTNENGANKVIERINKNLNNKSINGFHISVSLGSSTKHDMSINFKKLLDKADEEMFRNKFSNKNYMREKKSYDILKDFVLMDEEERIHSINVGNLSASLARYVGIDDCDIKKMTQLGMLHDIGKLAIDQEILSKQMEDLTDDEWEQLKKHSELGYEIIKPYKELSEAALSILYHHERWDGNGYPFGLKGEEIPIEARILNICGSYDYMTGPRSYREKMDRDYAISEILNNAGTQFDPMLADIFVNQVLVDI